jgi:hypothetical protein
VPVGSKMDTQVVIKPQGEEQLVDLSIDDRILKIRCENVDALKWLRIRSSTWLL